jgi:hypothetical protein
MIKKILTTMAISTSILYAANTAELNINTNTLAVKGQYGINELYNLSNEAKYNITLEYLSSEDTAIITQDTDRIVNLGLKIMNPYINDYGVSFGMGINVVWADNYTKTFIATPLSVFGDYAITEDINIDAAVSYSPKILSYSSASEYKELTTKVNYKVIDNGFAYLGYRNIKIKYDNGPSLSFDDSLFFGYKIQF